MTATRDTRPQAYLIIVLGCLAAAAAALVPVYPGIYKVDALALAAVMTPFVIYGMFSEDLRGPWLLVSGLVLLGVTLLLLAVERYLDYDGYRDTLLYWLPLATVAVALPLAWLFGRRDPYT